MPGSAQIIIRSPPPAGYLDAASRPRERSAQHHGRLRSSPPGGLCPSLSSGAPAFMPGESEESRIRPELGTSSTRTGWLRRASQRAELG
jgi:hypothetical protein